MDISWFNPATTGVGAHLLYFVLSIGGIILFVAIYTAAGRGEGLDVRAAYLHALKAGERRSLPVDKAAVRKARKRAESIIESIAAGEFEERGDKEKCTGCDMRALCKHAKCSKYDL